MLKGTNMYNRLLVFIMIVNYSIGSLVSNRGIPFNLQDVKKQSCNYKILKEHNLLDFNHNTILKRKFRYYVKYMKYPATDLMPELLFELKGIQKGDTFYYPKKLTIWTKNNILQEFEFDENNFSPSTSCDFGLEYGDYKFDGYGGFCIPKITTAQNPSYYFWLWDKENNCFVENYDLEHIAGFITFEYDEGLITVFSRGGAVYHELKTYKYINDKLTLIEKIIDRDTCREIYRLKDGELKLEEIIEVPLCG